MGWSSSSGIWLEIQESWADGWCQNNQKSVRTKTTRCLDSCTSTTSLSVIDSFFPEEASLKWLIQFYCSTSYPFCWEEKNLGPIDLEQNQNSKHQEGGHGFATNTPSRTPSRAGLPGWIGFLENFLNFPRKKLFAAEKSLLVCCIRNV